MKMTAEDRGQMTEHATERLGRISGLRLLFDSSLTANRYPLTATIYFLITRAGYRTWRRISQPRTGRKNCHRLSRQKGSDRGGRKEERRELESSAVPAIEATQALDDFGLGATGLGVGEDALQAGLGLLEGGQELAAE